VRRGRDVRNDVLPTIWDFARKRVLVNWSAGRLASYGRDRWVAIHHVLLLARHFPVPSRVLV
jgi:hypothetical protein